MALKKPKRLVISISIWHHIQYVQTSPAHNVNSWTWTSDFSQTSNKPWLKWHLIVHLIQIAKRRQQEVHMNMFCSKDIQTNFECYLSETGFLRFFHHLRWQWFVLMNLAHSNQIIFWWKRQVPLIYCCKFYYLFLVI